MKEVFGNIWEHYNRGCWIVIPTNGFVKLDGKAVMGRGLAKQASERFEGLSVDLGWYIKYKNNVPHMLDKYRMFSFPVKPAGDYKNPGFKQKADPKLIEQSAIEINKLAIEYEDIYKFDVDGIYIPRVGCGNGGLRWEDVKPILERNLRSDLFIVCSLL